MSGPRVVQLVAGCGVAALTAFAIAFRDDGIGFKGMPVTISSIVMCLGCSSVAAYVTARGWHWLPAPFLAGIVGVLAGGRLGPVGGVFGFLVGLAVVMAVIAESRLTHVRPMRFRTIWNVLLFVLGIMVCVLSAPHIMGQLQMVMRYGWVADSLALTWLASMIGLLIFEVMLLMSLGTWTWNLVGPRMRWLFATATALLLTGASVAAAVDYIELNSLVFDYIKFAICVVAMSFPIIFLRTGYVGLLVRIWRRRRDKSAVA